MDFITDRTAEDVARWRTLRDKGWDAMTSLERAEWLLSTKGRYTHADMNRVESAVQELAARLRELGYIPPSLSVKTNWTVSDIPTKTDFDRYFGNVEALSALISLPPFTPLPPSTETRLDYQRANDLEQILSDIDTVTTNLQKSWYFSGDILAGEA